MRYVEEFGELARIDSRELSGQLLETAPTIFVIRRIVPVVAAMSVEHSDLVIELSLDDDRVDIVSAGVDRAVRIGELPGSPAGSDATTSSAAPRRSTSRARARRRRRTISVERGAS